MESSEDQPSLDSHLLEDRVQGEVIGLAEISVIGDDGRPQLITVESGLVVVLTQTCDLIRSDREWVAVAPVIEVKSDTMGNVRRGQMPTMVELPHVNEMAVGDLCLVGSMSKRRFATLPLVHRPTEEQASRISHAIGRKFSRPALPDDVSATLKPMRERVISKDSKDSPEGRVINNRVERIRIKVDIDAETGTREVTVVLLVDRYVEGDQRAWTELVMNLKSEDDPKARLQACAAELERNIYGRRRRPRSGFSSLKL